MKLVLRFWFSGTQRIEVLTTGEALDKEQTEMLGKVLDLLKQAMCAPPGDDPGPRKEEG